MSATTTPSNATHLLRALAYLGLGVVFGILLLKGQIADWYRIQEMFRLQSFHMYGVIGSAVVVAMKPPPSSRSGSAGS